MTIAIAGAGIGGLSLALSLHQVGIPARIFETVAELRPLGVGINLQPHAVRELAELGLLDRLDGIGLRTEAVIYANHRGQTIWKEPRGVAAGYRWPQFSIHRGRLQMLLLDAVRDRLGPDAVHTGRTVEAWQPHGDGVAVTVRDRDGAAAETLPFELLIAADGIHSRLRATLYPDEGPPAWGGTVMWRGVTEGPRFHGGRTMVMAGTKRAKWVGYPIADLPGGRALVNWICDLHFEADHDWRREDWTRAGDRADFAHAFAGWRFDWLDIPWIIENAREIWEYPMVDRDPLPRWQDGRMTLLGDAAHAMYPIGSNGASQAILDARVLAARLAELGVGEAALAAYEAERRPATAALVMANRGDGPDKVLDIVEARAPEGFTRIEDVVSADELAGIAGGYKAVAGMDVETLNARPPLVPEARRVDG